MATLNANSVEGEWRGTVARASGTTHDVRVVFKGNSVTVVGASGEHTGAFTFERAENGIGQLDVEFEEGLSLGLATLEADVLSWVARAPGQERLLGMPSAVAVPRKSQLFTLQRHQRRKSWVQDDKEDVILSSGRTATSNAPPARVVRAAVASNPSNLLNISGDDSEDPGALLVSSAPLLAPDCEERAAPREVDISVQKARLKAIWDLKEPEGWMPLDDIEEHDGEECSWHVLVAVPGTFEHRFIQINKSFFRLEMLWADVSGVSHFKGGVKKHRVERDLDRILIATPQKQGVGVLVTFSKYCWHLVFRDPGTCRHFLCSIAPRLRACKSTKVTTLEQLEAVIFAEPQAPIFLDPDASQRPSQGQRAAGPNPLAEILANCVRVDDSLLFSLGRSNRREIVQTFFDSECATATQVPKIQGASGWSVLKGQRLLGADTIVLDVVDGGLHYRRSPLGPVEKNIAISEVETIVPVPRDSGCGVAVCLLFARETGRYMYDLLFRDMDDCRGFLAKLVPFLRPGPGRYTVPEVVQRAGSSTWKKA
mmetsp:Transcript_1049/g.2281  ORF Transcript_1049/g.2281 Transcript_1049/m.2281 type:complete len:539 (+) Transcript_1049:71-1687(+)